MRQSIAIVLVLCAACGGQRASQNAASPPAPMAASGSVELRPGAGDSVGLAALDIPREIGGFRAVRRRAFDNRVEGGVIRFVGPPPLTADVYIYPIVPPSFATSDAGRDSAATLEFGRAREGIYVYQTQSGRRAPRTIGEREIRAPAGGTRIARGHRATFAYQRDSVTWTSHLYVFGLRDRYVKVRSSYREQEGPAEPPPALDQFVQALVAAVAARSEPVAKP
jgi:hypothetical protein